MKLAIMQPYLFPYIGYFQLINLADKFIIYDDVNFIKQGWINRNRLLLNEKDYVFTVPLTDISSFKLIKDTTLNKQTYNLWKDRFLKTLEQGYKKAPYYSETINLVAQVIKKDHNNISQLACDSLLQVSEYLNIDTEFVHTSSIYNNANLSAQTRIIDICLKEQATEYINAYGGQKLYSYDAFIENKVILRFIKPVKAFYKQYDNEFIEGLSIIDVLMFNSVGEIKEMLNKYELI